MELVRARTDVAFVAAGGAAGAMTRYLVDVAVGTPTSTFLVNVVGSFLLGLVLYHAELGGVSETVRLLAAVGFLGSFTTYSTFAFELFTHSPEFAAGYLAVSYAAGFLAVAAALYLVEVLRSG